MSRLKPFRLAVCTALCALGVGSASATLMDRGGGMIYDSDLNITWLQNANYAATELTDVRRDAIISAVVSVAGHTLLDSDFQKSGADYTGRMTWWGAMAWVQELVFGGYSDWRLPTAVNQNGTGPCGPAFNCNSSEMGYMFYVDLGGAAMSGIQNTHNANYDVFKDIGLDYWSSTEYLSVQAWHFGFFFGNQAPLGRSAGEMAWAVRTGDSVSAPLPAPEPATLTLLGLGLAGLGFGRRRRACLPRSAYSVAPLAS